MQKLSDSVRGLLNAAGVFVYVSLVAWFMFNGEHLFGGDGKSFLIPVFMLMLFVLSAAITGSLVLGKPILMYLDGQKKEAVKLFFITLGWLSLFMLIVVGVLLIK